MDGGWRNLPSSIIACVYIEKFQQEDVWFYNNGEPTKRTGDTKQLQTQKTSDPSHLLERDTHKAAREADPMFSPYTGAAALERNRCPSRKLMKLARGRSAGHSGEDQKAQENISKKVV